MQLDIEPTIVRLTLRLYFIIALIITCVLGERCLRLRNSLRLLRGEDVGVANLTGWLRGFEPLMTAIRLRKLPGGWVGIPMIFASLLGIASDLSTNLISTSPYSTRCAFEQGIILSPAGSEYPSPFTAAAVYAQSVQIQNIFSVDSDGISGLTGIYYAFDPLSQAPQLFATDEDIAGKWICEPFSPVISFPLQPVAITTASLASQGYLYDECSFYNELTIPTSPPTTRQLVVLSASSATLGNSWNVKIAVDMLDDNSTYAKQMQAYNCTLYNYMEDDLVFSIRNSINVSDTLLQWVPMVQANLYTGYDSLEAVNGQGSGQVATILQIMLNSMIMVSGTQNSIDVKNTESLSYGCLGSGTFISNANAALILLVLTLVAFFLFYWISLAIAVYRARRQYDRDNSHQQLIGKGLCDSVPNSLLDWISHAIHKAGNLPDRPRHHRLSDWLISTKSSGPANQGLSLLHQDQVSHVERSSPSTIPMDSWKTPSVRDQLLAE